MVISFIDRTDALLPPTEHRSACGGRKSALLSAFVRAWQVCSSVRYIACRNFSFHRRDNGPTVRGRNATVLHMSDRESGSFLFCGSRGGSSVLQSFFHGRYGSYSIFIFFRRYKDRHPVLKRCIFAPRN